MAFVITSQLINPQKIADTSTTKRHALGTIVQAKDDTYGVGEFIYASGAANTVVGSWALINPLDFSTTLAIADDKGPIGVAMSANIAGPNYGWYQITGYALALTRTIADNGYVFLTSVAGTVDDASVAGDRIRNAKAGAAATTSGSTSAFEIWRPYAQDTDI